MLCMICDDEKSELERIQKIVSDYAEEHPELFLTIQCFSNPFDMLGEMDRSGAPDIALLDICMPGVLGTEVAREIQSRSEDATDIIFLTTSTEFAVEAFALHVNDYLTKPFDMREMLARLRVLTRKTNVQQSSILVCGNTSLNTGSFSLSAPGGSYKLASKEYQTMLLLMRSPETVISSSKFL